MLSFSRAEKMVMLFLLFIAAMLTIRIAYADNLRFVFLLWNLFLGWIPFQLSVVLNRSNKWPKWFRLIVLLLWLLFFPNALYIVTDLIHLEGGADRVPIWYDAVLLFSAALTGLIMAFVSLFQVERCLHQMLPASKVKGMIYVILFLGSFGVYLGRFQRWNSWDIVSNPFSLFLDTAHRFINPVAHFRTWAITCLFTCFFSLLYTGYKMMRLQSTR